MTEPQHLEKPAPTKEEVFAALRDEQGRYRTESLFKETRRGDSPYPAFFSLRPGPVPGHISLHDKYMEIGDPTEYEVALQLFGCWEHWERLCKSKWFAEAVEGYRRELELKRRSEALTNLKVFANRNDQLGYAANKAILDDTKPTKPPVGRPKSQPSPERVAADEDFETQQINQDAERLELA